MQMARVIGDVVATYKDPNFDSIKLMLVQPIGADGKDVGRPLVALDSVGAGVGETVFFVRGKEASLPFFPAEPPTDAGIVGIVDHYTVADVTTHS
jgi:microcompartment protein CcmK/EutM